MNLLHGQGAVHRCLLSLKLVPQAIRSGKIPTSIVGLGLVLVAAVFLAVASYQYKANLDAEVDRLRVSLSQRAPDIEQPIDPAVLASYGVNWASVLQAIVAAVPGDVRLGQVSFANVPSAFDSSMAGASSSSPVQVVIKGQASEYDEIIRYAENLRGSALFAKVTIQSMGEGPTATPTSTPTPASSMATATPGLPPAAGFQPTSVGSYQPAMLPLIPTGAPSSLPPATPTRAIFYYSTPTTTPTPVVITPTITFPLFPTTTPAGGLTTTATRTPASTTPLATATRTVSPTPTQPNNDFLVQTKTESCDLSLPANYSGDLITGKVLDIDGRGLANVRVRVASIYTGSPWSAETTTDSQGFFRFHLTKGNFKLEVLSGISQAANELWTRSADEPGACRWQVVFQKASARTPTPWAVGTATTTPTPTTTGTVSPTPTGTITPPSGNNITGTATASTNSSDAALAIDGDTATMWSAGAHPSQWWQETFDTVKTVTGFTLIVAQTPGGNTTHVVRLFGATGAEVGSSAVTLTGNTSDGQQITRAYATAVSGVQTVRVETTDGPSHVAWREVRIFSAPATPTATPTPRTWQQAQPIAIGETQSRYLYSQNDYDWARFRTAWISGTDRITYTVRAIGSAGMDTDLYLYESNGDTGFAGYWNDNCGSGTLDPLIVQPLKVDTTYYLKATNRSAVSGTYTLTVRSDALDCNSTAGSSASAAADVAGLAGAEPDGRSTRSARFAAPLDQPSELPAAIGPAGDSRMVNFAIVLDVKVRGKP